MIIVYAALLLIGGLMSINAVFAYQTKHVDPAFWPSVWYMTKLLPVLLISNLMISFGVKFLYKMFHNLTFALTLAKGVEILVCVVIGFLFMKEIPNWKTLVGLGIIIFGFWVSKLK